MKEEIFRQYAERMKGVIRRRRMSKETRKSYQSCLRGYARYLCSLDREEVAGLTSEEKVSRYLGSLCEKSASTQRQNLNALVFFYRHVLEEPLGDLPPWTYAKRPRRLPTWLGADECLTLFRHMDGQPQLMAEIMFGTGIRLREAVQLRVQDLDFAAGGLKVRAGKGNKDRVTCLPQALVPALRDQVERCRDSWRYDREHDVAPVPLPDGLERKYPRGGSEFEWYWLFPARGLVRSASEPIRWHLHPSTLGKALSAARRKAGIGKRVTAHTLRHSFATNALQGGMPIHELKALMGHVSIRTTEIYLHCLPSVGARSTSPLDMALAPDAAKVVTFPQPVSEGPPGRSVSPTVAAF